MDIARDAASLEGRSLNPWRLALCAGAAAILVFAAAIAAFAYGPATGWRYGVDLGSLLIPEGEPNAWVAPRPISRAEVAVLTVEPAEGVRLESLIVWPLNPQGPVRMLPLPPEGGQFDLQSELEPELRGLGLGLVVKGAGGENPVRHFSVRPRNLSPIHVTVLTLGSWLATPPWDAASVHIASTSKILGPLPLPIALMGWFVLTLALTWMTGGLGRAPARTLVGIGLAVVLLADVHWMGILTHRLGQSTAPLVPEQAGEDILNTHLATLEGMLSAPERIVMFRPKNGTAEFWEARTRFHLAAHRVMAGDRSHVRRLIALGVPFHVLQLDPDGRLDSDKAPRWLAREGELTLDTPQMRLWSFR